MRKVIKNFEVTTKGLTVDEAYIGTWKDVENFVNETAKKLEGIVEISEPHIFPFQIGEHINIMSNPVATVKKLKFIPKTLGEAEVFFDRWEDGEDGEYVYGLYFLDKRPLTKNELEELKGYQE